MLREDALTATKDAKKSRKKCTQLQTAIEETQELFHQERAKQENLREKEDTIKWNDAYCRWRLVKCRRRLMNTNYS